MQLRQHILGTLAAAAVMWAAAGIWHQLILAKFYAQATGATHEGTGIILIAYLILGALMSFLYSRISLGGRAGRPVPEGLKFGVLIGVLWVFPHELALAGAHGESLLYPFQNAAVHMVEQGLGGIAIALVHGKSGATR